MKKLPDFEAWAVFAKVAETGSFARTANELGLSQPTVSKAIARLEARLQTTLFHRTSRRMVLTDSGEAALERATRILHEGESVEAEMLERTNELRGTIRVAAPMSFGIAQLAPLLPTFMQRYPAVDLQLHFSDEQVDLVGERFDLALRIANLEDSSLLARQLCPVPLYLVGTASYFARYGMPQHPSDLAQHVGLQYSYSKSGNSWHFRHADGSTFTQVMRIGLQANNAEALSPALYAGLGLALQPAFLAWEGLQNGTLQMAMPQWHPTTLALHLVTPPGRSRPARVQAFMDYVAEQLQQAPWLASQSSPLL